MITYKDELLMHYGIKGQKKGRRRFQNPDGSLTPAGKLRYLNPSSKRNTGSYVRLKESGSGKNESALDRAEIKDRTGGAASAAASGAIVAAKYGEGTHRGYKSSYRSSGPDTSPDRKYDYNVANLDENGSILNTEHYKRVYDEKGNSHYELASLGVPRMSTAGVTKTYSNGKYDIFFNDEKNKPDVVQRTDDKSFPDRFTTYEGYWKDGKKRTIVYDREQGKIIYDEQGRGFPKGSKGEAAINAMASGAASAAINTANNSAAQKKASTESERYRKMTERGKKQIEAENKKKEQQQGSSKESYQVLPSKENGTVTFTRKSKDGSLDDLRRESAAKVKQRLTPEKSDKVKKALAEKRTKKAVTKPKANKNRREEIQ